MKKYICILLAISCFAQAQDFIIKKNGDEIKAKVLEINNVIVKYKKFDLPDGPMYQINKSEVFMIKYPDGSKDIFNNPAQERTSESVRQRENPTPPAAAVTTKTSSTPITNSDSPLKDYFGKSGFGYAASHLGYIGGQGGSGYYGGGSFGYLALFKKIAALGGGIALFGFLGDFGTVAIPIYLHPRFFAKNLTAFYIDTKLGICPVFGYIGTGVLPYFSPGFGYNSSKFEVGIDFGLYLNPEGVGGLGTVGVKAGYIF